MQQVAHHHRPIINVEHLADPITGVIVQVLIQPFQRIMVRLTHASKVADDRIRSAKVDIGSIRATRIQLLGIAGANDLHGSGKSGQIAIRLLFFHIAHANKAPGHDLAIYYGAPGNIDQPGKILAGADLQCEWVALVESGLVSFFAQDLKAIIGNADKRPLIALLA